MTRPARTIRPTVSLVVPIREVRAGDYLDRIPAYETQSPRGRVVRYRPVTVGRRVERAGYSPTTGAFVVEFLGLAPVAVREVEALAEIRRFSDTEGTDR